MKKKKWRAFPLVLIALGLFARDSVERNAFGNGRNA